MRRSDGKIYGVIHKGRIYLNGNLLNSNTPIHEASHVFMQWAKSNAPDLYQAGLALMDRSPYLKAVKASKFYRDQAARMKRNGASDEEIEDFYRDEALARSAGDAWAKFTGSRKVRFREWLNKFWNKVKALFGKASPKLENMKPGEVSRMTWREFSDAVARRILSEEKLGSKGKRPKLESTKLMAEDDGGKEKSVPLINKNGDINYERLGEEAADAFRVDGLPPSAEQSLRKGGKRNVEASLLLRGSEKADRREPKKKQAGIRSKNK